MSDLFDAYTTSFLHGLSLYAHVDAVTAPSPPADMTLPYITLSQHLTVDGSPFIAGLAVPADAFYAFAAGYSGVCLDSAEELAIDAAGELFNVINGHFSSKMRARGCAVSIMDPPRHAYAAPLPAHAAFLCAAESPCGTLHIALSREEFLPG
jgi:hypothetical protein